MLLLASGRGERLGGDIPKAYVPCRGASLVARSLARLTRIAEHREIVLAINPADRATHLPPLAAALDEYGPVVVVDGGATRQESMRRAFAASHPRADVILVHDAARPFFPIEAAKRAVAAAYEVGAALLAMPVPDTLKRCNADGHVLETVDRAGVWLAQTPQVIRRDRLIEALARADADGFEGTDDVSLCEHAGQPVVVVEGSRTNLKITTPADLRLAELIAAAEDGA